MDKLIKEFQSFINSFIKSFNNEEGLLPETIIKMAMQKFDYTLSTYIEITNNTIYFMLRDIYIKIGIVEKNGLVNFGEVLPTTTVWEHYIWNRRKQKRELLEQYRAEREDLYIQLTDLQDQFKKVTGKIKTLENDEEIKG